jgi:hypothetical protein
MPLLFRHRDDSSFSKAPLVSREEFPRKGLAARVLCRMAQKGNDC